MGTSPCALLNARVLVPGGSRLQLDQKAHSLRVTMLTPAFDLSQDPDFLTIIIKVPYARVSEFDVYYEGEDFKFYAKPYFLRLTLPGRIVEDGREKASYNVDEGTFTVKLPKETPGEHFEGLGMLTTLLAQKGTRSAKPLVEELDTPTEPEEDDDDFDWQVEQAPFEEYAVPLNSQCSYGFGNLRSGVFSRLQDELNDVIDLKSPDITPVEERQPAQLAAEDVKFDPDHYLADLFEDDAIQQMLKYRPWWAEASAKTTAQEGHQAPEQGIQEPHVVFSDEEKQQLRNFKNKSFLLDKKSRCQAFLSLIDILLAYCYDVRIAEGEKNVESSWNIRKLSGTLSWLQSYNSVYGVLVSFGRRTLCYPLYRHFKLVMKAVKDASLLLAMGKAAVLKCFLEIHRLFQANDAAYILNDLYISDYCVWIQKVKSKKLAALAECLQTTALDKADLGFELEELELAARLVQEEAAANAAAGVDSKPLRRRHGSHQAATSDSEESSSSSEDSDSDSSSSSEDDEDSSSETEESDSGEEECADREGGKTASSKSPLGEESPASLLEGHRLIQDAEAAVEDIGERFRTVVLLSERSEGLVTEGGSSLQDAPVCPNIRPELDQGKQNCSSLTTPISGDLVEELGKQFQAAVVFPKISEEMVSGMAEERKNASPHCEEPAQRSNGGKCVLSLDPAHVSRDLLAEKLQKVVSLQEPSEEWAAEVDRRLQSANTHCTQEAQKRGAAESGLPVQSTPISKVLVEEIGEHLQTPVISSGGSEGELIEAAGGLQDPSPKVDDSNDVANFLDVCHAKNILRIVPGTEDEEA
ncbi:protein SHQ1 homolog isoform X2 [Ambystoma mexicanum]|uniref:protein SHQ1 homolog isoform X2 n=1 Tax=Ambystoma mexicanum TaxID=8296 RepID=UPI0037E7EAC7